MLTRTQVADREETALYESAVAIGDYGDDEAA